MEERGGYWNNNNCVNAVMRVHTHHHPDIRSNAWGHCDSNA